ncbi:hypothetical protein [Micromonospora sp. b486]|uniref:hypothetical protein n=1 Tax=Micromonospora sp. b486 TaxID=3053986 RepID=UPI00259CE61D|nr:hypothetical protein [Micromonospora sp. b486]MDM4784690.1 hypothetical protein [Micromonospora sp. b486]
MTRAQAHYVAAAPGIPLLDPASQACMRTAYALYGGNPRRGGRAGLRRLRPPGPGTQRRRMAVAARALLTPVRHAGAGARPALEPALAG